MLRARRCASRISFVALSGAVALIAACSGGTNPSGGDGGTGDGGNPGSCSAFTACGGNLVGTWRLSAFCGNAVASMCAQATATINGVPDATATFNADGTELLTEASGTLTLNMTFPSACFDPDGGISPATCDQLGGAMGGTCTGGPPADCKCTVQQTVAASSTPGTYTTSGSSVTINSSSDAGSGSTTVFDYCVQGNTLLLSNSSSGVYDVFTKQ